MSTSVVSVMGGTELLPRDTMTESDKWRYIFDNSTKLASVGFLAGSAASFLIFKSVTIRMGVTALGAGFGLGKSYVDARYVLGHDVTADVHWSVKDRSQ
jgi:MICOS complex subunit MIC10